MNWRAAQSGNQVTGRKFKSHMRFDKNWCTMIFDHLKLKTFSGGFPPDPPLSALAPLAFGPPAIRGLKFHEKTFFYWKEAPPTSIFGKTPLGITSANEHIDWRSLLTAKRQHVWGLGFFLRDWIPGSRDFIIRLIFFWITIKHYNKFR